MISKNLTPEQQRIVETVAGKVRRVLNKEDPSHDWPHVRRVQNMAVFIGERENADIFVIVLAALLHDVGDWKLYRGDETVGPRLARQILNTVDVPTETVTHVCEIIATMSFKGAGVESRMTTLEGKVVQDADRLDALGAIGIARCFSYGGHKGRPIHDSSRPPVFHQTKESYLQESTSINHFYEKLLLLADLMNTETGRTIARERHRLMEGYLKKFHLEWEGLDAIHILGVLDSLNIT